MMGRLVEFNTTSHHMMGLGLIRTDCGCSGCEAFTEENPLFSQVNPRGIGGQVAWTKVPEV